MRIIGLFFFIACFVGATYGQQTDEVIVKLRQGLDLRQIQNDIARIEGVDWERLISRQFRLALLKYDAHRRAVPEIQRLLSQDFEWVASAFANAEFRAVPNDPEYPKQWAPAYIGADKFWDVTNGGRTFGGDSIVVAVMESGTSITHPDLAPNFFHNTNEIAGDGIDNDANGYVDDFTGWNSVVHNDAHPFGPHGTKVTGIVGAKGNNEMGVAGVNWNVRLLPLTFSKVSFATYFESFEYLIAMRKLYNETAGAKGAFIVAVNESFGIDNAHPADNPNYQQWCEYIDALGQVGILTVAATSNQQATDVDISGDMPTTCPQQYLISVTSIGQSGTRYGAYGLKNIDLAAPGDGIFTTAGIEDYSSFGGTSAASPHVAGAVGLIYSYPCKAWSDFAMADPSGAALQVKKWILDNTHPSPALIGKTVSGGSLDLNGVLTDLDFFCNGNSLEKLDFRIVPNPFGGDVAITYDTPRFGDFELQLFDVLGHSVWKMKSVSEQYKPQKIQLNFDFLPEGIYFLRMQQGTTAVVKRLVKIGN